jgi:mRNA interferase YafQ
MRTIRYTAKFKKDYKREEKSGHHRVTLDTIFFSVIKILAMDSALQPPYRDHQLSGD